MKRNYVMAPAAEYINTGWVDGQWLGSNGQCSLFKCQEWIDHVPHYPELVREEVNGFAICPKCGGSYGKDAMTGEEYRAALSGSPAPPLRSR